MRRMTDEEARAFMAGGTRTGKLAVVRRDGSPLVTPVWFVLDDEHRLVFTTGADTVKGRALRRDPRCSICVDEASPPFDHVRVDGVAELRDARPQTPDWATR